MSQTLSILLVDDDEVDRLAVSHALRQSGLEAKVDQADSLKNGRQALRETPYDCLVLDYHLGDGHATTLLTEHTIAPADSAFERPHPDLPPVIILTGSGNESVAVELMKAGATDYLPKDELTPSRIAQSVRNALRVHASEAAAREAQRDLELRVVERTSALAEAYRELEQQMDNRQKAEEQARQHLEQLAHVARLSTLGELAAELAHELNQPLGAIANYAHGCVKRIENDTADQGTVRQVFVNIAEQAERAGKIIHRLRRLVERHEPVLTPIDLNTLLKDILGLQQAELSHRQVQLKLDLSPELPKVQADTIQLQQVVLNLVRNGIEAVAELPPARRVLSLRSWQAGHDRLGVSVRDEGVGCSPEQLQRVFEPFYSTKERGMGMGLAISRSIVEAHGGELWVMPNPEAGLTFRFTLPAEDKDKDA
ncbi:MAG: ATP-binding protein [Acidobacteriota bacterium]